MVVVAVVVVVMMMMMMMMMIVRMYRASSPPLQARGKVEIVVMVERPLLLNWLVPMGYRWTYLAMYTSQILAITKSGW